MKFIDSIRNLLRRSTTAGGDVANTTATTPRTGGVPLLPNVRALNVATVYRCVNLLADSVANLPIQYMRMKGDIFVEDKSSRLHYLLNVQPCSYMSAVDFWRQVVQYLLFNGNAYIVPVYDFNIMDVERLALIDPTTVMHDVVNDTYTINDVYAGVSGVYREADIIHIKNYTRDGKTGLSTIGFARTTLDITGTGDAETLNRFANGGNVRGLVSNDTSVRGFGEYQDKQLEEAANNLDERFRSGERIVSLPGQVQFSPISLSSTDMQFLETRKFSVREICRFFGVHPSFVFDDTSNNYKSAEMANVAFLSNTLNPILRKIETELHRKLVAPTLCCKRKFKFDRRELYACDLDSRIKYQSQTIAAGIYTVNEWRREENKPAVEGGDNVLVSANLKGIKEAGKPTEPVETKPEEPVKEPNENGEE
ncbi:phage portal protein [uncultured Bacteroides sp.]|uniref:phage portal protein n=1 Tax=uncultured Bacteroides sp. TaxID=162156 RepID=UPI0025D5C868|nr:phage portal protein [uncultured Bacteroides sp.]